MHEHHKNAFTHIFERRCKEGGIKQRKTKVKHPWTNGQVERIHRTLKEATVNSFTYKTHEQLKEHLNAYVLAYNFAKRLKSLKGKSPWEFIVNQWKEHPEYFHVDPNQCYLGPNMGPSKLI